MNFPTNRSVSRTRRLPAGEICPGAYLGECGRKDGPLTVTEVLGEDGESRRLGELGLCLGRTVSVIRGGNPAIVEIDGSRLAISRALLERVRVLPLGA